MWRCCRSACATATSVTLPPAMTSRPTAAVNQETYSPACGCGPVSGTRRSLAGSCTGCDRELSPRSNAMNKPHRVVAGIDFGTYGTGFAWAPVSEDNDEPGRRRISFFEDWAGQKSVGYPKNRSAVLLDAGGEFVTWGYEALAQMTSAPPGSGLRLRTGFKMALQPGPPDPAAAVA